MAHSFGQLLRRITDMWGKFQPYLYYWIYWFAFPAVFFYGKSKFEIVHLYDEVLFQITIFRGRTHCVDTESQSDIPKQLSFSISHHRLFVLRINHAR